MIGIPAVTIIFIEYIYIYIEIYDRLQYMLIVETAFKYRNEKQFLKCLKKIRVFEIYF